MKAALIQTIAFVLCAGSASLHGQPTFPERGIVPNGFYELSKMETIDAVEGSVNLRVPIASFPSGRSGSGFQLSLSYNSTIYAPSLQTDLVTGGLWAQLLNVQLVDPYDSGGWHYNYEYAIGATDIQQPGNELNNCAPGETILRLLLPDGSSHILNGLNMPQYMGNGTYTFFDPLYPACGPSSIAGEFYTSDGTYLHVSGTLYSVRPNAPSFTIYFPDGRIVTRMNDVETIADRNGNKITVTGVSATTTTLSDDLNRTITISRSPNQDVIQQAGFNNQPLQWTVNWTSVTLPSSPAHIYKCDYSLGPCDAAGLGGIMVTSIQLPVPGLSYQFQYDVSTGWGQLSQMTTPSGATVQYAYHSWDLYPNTVQNVAPGSIMTKTVSWMDDSLGFVRTELSSYAFTPTSSTFTNPDEGATTHYFYAINHYDYAGVNGSLSGLVYRVTQPDGAGVERIWSQNLPYGVNSTPLQYAVPGNPYIQTEFVSVASGTAPTLAAAKVYTYDRNGNRTNITESDWLPYGDINHQADSQADPSAPVATGLVSTATPTILRTTTNSYVNGAQTATSTGYTVDDSNAYWNVHSPQLLALLCQTTVGPATTLFAYDTQAAPSCSPASGVISHGNVVQELRWDSAATAYRTTKHGYDIYGNLTSTQNPRGFTTNFIYDANALYMVEQDKAAEDTANTRKFTYNHDFDSGALTTQVDVDHAITTNYGYDQYGRLVSTQEGGVRSQFLTYNDLQRTITENSDRNCFGDGNPVSPANCSNLPPGTPTGPLVKTTWYDQLGQVRQQQDWAGNLVQNNHLIGSVSGTCSENATAAYELVSNPFVTQTEATMGWIRTKRDTLGRVVEVKHYSGSALPAPWGTNCTSTGTATYVYNANATTYADEANNSWVRSTDGLGRLTQVVENGIGATTQYGYDAVDDLTSVTPAAGQGRSFTYTSLKQLASATNPETSTIAYTYDANGNLLTRTDARGIVTTYCLNNNTNTCYNGLDQPEGKSYSDTGSNNPTPWVGYSYNKGWLTQVSAGSTSYNYTTWDGIGRVTNGYQATNNQNYAFQVAYMPVVGIQSIQYPNSARLITTTYDSGGRPFKLSGQIGANAATNYVTATTYATQGEIATLAMGNSLTETRQYNARLQPTQIQVGTLFSISNRYDPSLGADLNCSGASTMVSGNNGNVLGQTVNGLVRNYSYDGVNRICLASQGSTWTQGYSADTRGNLAFTTWTGQLPNETADVITSTGVYTANNRVSSWAYDASGNVTGIPAAGGTTVRAPCAVNVMPGVAMMRTACYDAENRMISETDANGNTATYAYDGDGRRVSKTFNGVTTTFVYDPQGHLAQDYGGPTISLSETGTRYVTTDHLGTTRLLTKADGTVAVTYDYLPFGMEFAQSADTNRIRFTGKERDAESGLDFFGARYFSSAQGRFTRPDYSDGPAPVPFANLSDPQTLNLYAYVRNNPLAFADGDGHMHQECAAETSSVDEYNVLTIHANCRTVMDASDYFMAGVAVGHHFVDQATIRAKDAWTSFAGRFFRSWTTGMKSAKNVFNTPHRLNSAQIRQIIDDVEERFGPMSTWGKEAINEAVEEVRSAGGSVKSFLDELERDVPLARTVRDDVAPLIDKAEAAFNAARQAAGSALTTLEQTPVIGPIVEGVESACESEPNCGIPPP